MSGWIYATIARIRALFFKSQLDQNVDYELASHIEMLTDDNVRLGMDREAAHRDALIRIGSLDAAREQHRDARGIPWVESLMQDVRLAVRLALKSPWLCAIALLSLAIGIGANLTAFGIAKAILWQPLPSPVSERLVAVYNRANKGAGAYSGLSYPEYEYLRDHNDVLDEFATYIRIYFTVHASGDTQRVYGELVSSNFFSVLGVRTIQGRSFQPVDDRKSGLTPEVVISDGLWHREFGGAPNVIGKALRIGERSFTVVGVADKDFRGVVMDWVDPPQFWIPISTYPGFFTVKVFDEWNWHVMMVAGRMKPGVDANRASAELKTLDRRISDDHPERKLAFHDKYDYAMDVLPIQQARFFPGARDEVLNYIRMVAVVVAIVLVIACLNLANLMVARTTARRRELAVRVALGASRGRLIRQMLVESLLLSFIGGAGGFIVAEWAWKIIAGPGTSGHFGRPFRVSLPADLRIDPQIALFALGLSVLTGVLFGVWPAWKASKVDVHATLKEDLRSGGIAGLRVRSALIAIQIAASVVLLVGAGLFVQTVRNADAVGRLIDRNRIGVSDINMPPEQGSQFLDHVRAIPGVKGACLTKSMSNAGEIAFTPPESAEPVLATVAGATVCEDYFPMRGIDILSGRDFAKTDASPVIIVNETLAKLLAPSHDPVGQRIILKVASSYVRASPIQGASFQVIGVVKDTPIGHYRDGIRPSIYISSAQFPNVETTLEFQADGPPASVFPMIRDVLRQFNPDTPLVNPRTLQEDLDFQLSRERLTAALIGVLAIVAFGLTLIGLYGVVSYAVTSRMREIGIRMAIGAQVRDVLRMLAAQNMAMVVVGLAIGVAGSFVVTRMIASMLYGVEPSDATSFLAAVGLITAFALLATLIPSWRASHMAPSRILRHE